MADDIEVTQENDLFFEFDWPEEDYDWPLNRKKMCYYRVLGYGWAEIRKMVGLSPSTINHFRARNKDKIALYQKAIHGVLLTQERIAMSPLVPAALRVMTEKLQSQDEHIQLSAAKFILEHMFGKAIAREIRDGTLVVTDTQSIVDKVRKYAGQQEEDSGDNSTIQGESRRIEGNS